MFDWFVSCWWSRVSYLLGISAVIDGLPHTLPSSWDNCLTVNSVAALWLRPQSPKTHCANLFPFPYFFLGSAGKVCTSFHWGSGKIRGGRQAGRTWGVESQLRSPGSWGISLSGQVQFHFFFLLLPILLLEAFVITNINVFAHVYCDGTVLYTYTCKSQPPPDSLLSETVLLGYFLLGGGAIRPWQEHGPPPGGEPIILLCPMIWVCPMILTERNGKCRQKKDHSMTL